MDECRDCEFKGYSPQVCRLHAQHCQKLGARPQRPLPPAIKTSAKALAGAGLGVAAVVVGSAMVSFVGGAAVLHAVLGKLILGAGMAGGGVGLYRGINKSKHEANPGPKG
jgi:hypothetical protein